MASADAANASDALVFFGATGDLAYKKIFPALQNMVRHGHLSVPVIGVAKSGWTVERLRERAQASLKEYGGGVDPAAWSELAGRLQYIDGDYADPATFTKLRAALGDGKASHPLPRDPAEPLRQRHRGALRSRAAPTAPASSSRSPSGTTSRPRTR